MPPRTIRTPENHVPTDEDLLRLVQRRPGISLRELCGEVWPDLMWRSERPVDDSAARRVRDNGLTAAAWLRVQMAGLIARELVRPLRRTDEIDSEAAIGYTPVGGYISRPALQPDQDNDARRQPRVPGEERRRKKGPAV